MLAGPGHRRSRRMKLASSTTIVSMSRQLKFSLIALMLLATVSCSPQTRAPGTYVYRLDGDEDHGQKADRPVNNLHGWPVLERKVVADPSLAGELLARLGLAIDEGECQLSLLAAADARAFAEPACAGSGLAVSAADRRF